MRPQHDPAPVRSPRLGPAGRRPATPARRGDELGEVRLRWQDPEANRAHFAELIAEHAADSDLILLPEMFATGVETH